MNFEQRVQSLPAELFNQILMEVRTFSSGRVLLSNDTSKRGQKHIREWQGTWCDFGDARVVKAFPELREEYLSTKTFMTGPMDFGTSACFDQNGLTSREDLRLWKKESLSSAFDKLAHLEVHVTLVASARRKLSCYYRSCLDDDDDGDGSLVMWHYLSPLDLHRTTLPNLKSVTLDCRQCLPDDNPPPVPLTQIRSLGFSGVYRNRWQSLESATVLTKNPHWGHLVHYAMNFFEAFTAESKDGRFTRSRIPP